MVGDATPSQVLAGKTFTSNSGVGISGTMPNKSAWSSTPTAPGKVTIPTGYHNGSGYVDTSAVYNKGITDGKTSATLTKVCSTGELGGKGFYDDGTGNGERTLSFTQSLTSYDKYREISNEDIVLILKKTTFHSGINNNTTQELEIDSYIITDYNPSNGILSFDVTYSASWSRVYYMFDIFVIH